MRLFGFGPAFGLADASPFVLKVEAWLRLAGLPYDKLNDIARVRGAPKGKLPVLDDEGQIVPDSSAIIQHLARTRGVDLDADLHEAQRREAFWVSKTLEEHLYFIGVWARWCPDEHWPLVREALFGGVPRPMRGLVSGMVRRKIKQQVWQQGTARHSHDEIAAMAHAVFTHLSDGLGEQAYWFGETPHSVDATLYAFLAFRGLSTCPSTLPALDAWPNLVAYMNRMHQRCGFANGVHRP